MDKASNDQETRVNISSSRAQEIRDVKRLSENFDKDWENFLEQEWNPFIERHQT
jgi:hypothetical protein